MPVSTRWLNLGLLLGLLAGLAVFLFFPSLFERFTFCWIKEVTGKPCPSCGTTRAAFLLVAGDWRASLHMNPLGLLNSLLYLVVAFWLGTDLIRGRSSFWRFVRRPWPAPFLWVLGILMLGNWWWNLSKGL